MAATGGWQTSVSTVPGVAVAGDFCDSNPRYTLDAGPGGLVAGNAGVTVGRFAWVSSQFQDPDNAPTVVNSFGSGGPSGFVGRNQQALITTYLADAGMVIPEGFQMFLYTGGGFWIKNDSGAQAQIGQKVYASLATGQAIGFAGPGAPGSASITGSLATNTGTVTGSISGNVLTVTGSGASALVAGALIYGTLGGSGIFANTMIVSQLSGSIGAVGTYALSSGEQTVGPGTISFSYGILTVTVLSSGTIGVGGLVTGTGVTVGTTVSALGTGVGGTGTYFVNFSQSAISGAMTIGTSVETRFTTTSACAAGELVKMSDRPSAAA